MGEKRKSIVFSNPITKENITIQVYEELIENSPCYPVAIACIIDGYVLTVFVDAHFRVRGVQPAIIVQSTSGGVESEAKQNDLNKNGVFVLSDKIAAELTISINNEKKRRDMAIDALINNVQ